MQYVLPLLVCLMSAVCVFFTLRYTETNLVSTLLALLSISQRPTTNSIMQGFTTSALALTFFLVALFSSSYIVYKPIKSADGAQMYEVNAAPHLVCMHVFDKAQMDVSTVCIVPLKGGQLKFQPPVFAPFYTLYFPFGGAGASITDAEAEQLQTVLACIIIGAIAALIANGAHYEWVQRRLMGYRHTFTIVTPAAVPLVSERGGSSLASQSFSGEPLVNVVGDPSLAMPNRIVWTAILANIVAGF